MKKVLSFLFAFGLMGVSVTSTFAKSFRVNIPTKVNKSGKVTSWTTKSIRI